MSETKRNSLTPGLPDWAKDMTAHRVGPWVTRKTGCVTDILYTPPPDTVVQALDLKGHAKPLMAAKDVRWDEVSQWRVILPPGVSYVPQAPETVPEDSPKSDMVTLPHHYARFPLEPIRFIGENKLDWFQGNIVKYIMRADAKNGMEDIRKAKRYLEMYEKYLLKDPDWWRR